MREPYVKRLEGPLWEMRMKGKDEIARAAYVTAASLSCMSFRKRRRKRRAATLKRPYDGRRRYDDKQNHPR
jgi:hypothetical protein